MSAPTSAPKINTSSLPQTLPLQNPTSKPLPHPTHAALTQALLSANSIPRIEAALSESLAASGWTTSLRTYIINLVRSGECVSYADVLAKVLAAVQGGNVQGSAANGVDGLKFSPGVIKDALGVVRGEVEKVVDLRVDDVDD